MQVPPYRTKLHHASAVPYDGAMLGTTYDSQVCSIARSLEVVGERWSLLILRNALFAGSTRYGEFRRSLGIATNILQDRLDGLVDAGIFERRALPNQSELHEYILKNKGRDFAPALIALTEWGDRWAAPDGPPILYRHATCGSSVRVDVRCDACGSVEDLAAIEALPGPGMPADRAERILQRVASQA
jgi:DNA-binding HxlR family transcriptional regulator